MDLLWFFGGLLLLGWIMSLFESAHNSTNIYKQQTLEKLTPSQKEYQRQYRIWTTEINGVGVDPNSYWGKIREEVFRRYHDCCADCGSMFDLTVHHKLPLSQGGTNDIENLILICKDCHEARHDRKFFGRSFDADENYGKNYKISRKVQALLSAQKGKYGVPIKYKDRNNVRSYRIIHPKIISRIPELKNQLYVSAYCELDKADRLFKVSRLTLISDKKNLYIDKPKNELVVLSDYVTRAFKKYFG